MGANFSIPEEELRELTKWTSFKKKDLKRWYRKFMRSYPDGKLKKEQFNQLYGELYSTTTDGGTDGRPDGQMSPDDQFAQHIFRSFDRNNNGFVSFKELMLTFSVASSGTKREKLEWSFNVFDVAQNGKITMENVHQIVDCIRECRGSEEVAMSRLDVADLFVKIDKDGDGCWSLEEFIEGTRNYPTFFRKTLTVNRSRQDLTSQEGRQ